MEQLIIYLLLTNFVMIVWVMKLRKQNDILHNNNIDRKTSLINFIEESPRKKMSCIEGQMNIFDYL